jgi:succinyl-diaminopimelate desuccinylase
MNSVIEILKNLVAIKSECISDESDYSYLINILSAKGFKTQLVSEQGVSNLWAKYGEHTSEFDLVFSCHLDIVPAGDRSKWKHDPFTLTLDNKILYGRGTVDMKSSIAAFIGAFDKFIELNPNVDPKIGILITGDEETTSYGAQTMTKWLKTHDINIKNILIGEPTSEKFIGDIIKNGRRGSANFDLKILGVQGHAAYPDKTDNPINKIGNVINNLVSFRFDDGNDSFQDSNLVVTSIDAHNKARNVIPGSVQIQFNIRYGTGQTKESLISTASNLIEKNLNPQEYKLEIFSNSNPFLCEKSDFSKFLVKSIEKVTGKTTEYSTYGGTSDGRFLCEIAPIIEFGPFNQTAHKIDEHISLEDLQLLENIYFESLAEFYK